MAIKISDECINCGACEPECPNNAIYEGGMEWHFSDGTSLSGTITPKSGGDFDADASQEPVDYDVYYIVTDKCTECKGSEVKHLSPALYKHHYQEEIRTSPNNVGGAS